MKELSPQPYTSTRSLAQGLSALWEITKPKLTRLVVLTSLAGASVAPGKLNFWGWLSLLYGSWAIVAAANVFNCYLEKDVDALMDRTKDRPLVKGTLSSLAALVWGCFLSSTAVLVLTIGTTATTTALGLAGFFLYVLAYTPLKRISMHSLFIGAIPGAIPPMMGWSAAEKGHLGTGAFILFLILFFWQLPHFIAIALNRKGEYQNAGLKTLPGDMGEARATWQMLLYTVALVGASFLPVLTGLAGFLYFVISATLGVLFLSFCAASFFRTRALNWGKLIFWGSLVYLPLVLGGWVFDHLLNP